MNESFYLIQILETSLPNEQIQRDYEWLKQAFDPFKGQIVLVQADDTHFQRILLGHQEFEYVN